MISDMSKKELDFLKEMAEISLPYLWEYRNVKKGQRPTLVRAMEGFVLALYGDLSEALAAETHQGRLKR